MIKAERKSPDSRDIRIIIAVPKNGVPTGQIELVCSVEYGELAPPHLRTVHAYSDNLHKHPCTKPYARCEK